MRIFIEYELTAILLIRGLFLILQFFVFAGKNFLNSTEYLDPETNEWTNFTPKPEFLKEGNLSLDVQKESSRSVKENGHNGTHEKQEFAEISKINHKEHDKVFENGVVNGHSDKDSSGIALGDQQVTNGH